LGFIMGEGQRSGSIRYATSVAILFVILAAIGCGSLLLLPHQDSADGGLRTRQELADAYARVRPGTTPASQLARLGFDSGSPNAEVLSYLGVLERFMPRDSTKFDRLDAALQNCIQAQDRCTALVFTPGDRPRPSRGGVLAALGFGSAAASSDEPQVTLLVQDGRVAYKMMLGASPMRTAREVPPVSAIRGTEPEAAPIAFRTLY
jgi:hypothetical protein